MAGTPDLPFLGSKLRNFLLGGGGWPYLLVPFIPIAIGLKKIPR